MCTSRTHKWKRNGFVFFPFQIKYQMNITIRRRTLECKCYSTDTFVYSSDLFSKCCHSSRCFWCFCDFCYVWKFIVNGYSDNIHTHKGKQQKWQHTQKMGTKKYNRSEKSNEHTTGTTRNQNGKYKYVCVLVRVFMYFNRSIVERVNHFILCTSTGLTFMRA